MLEDAANAAVVGDTPTTGWKTTPAGFERATPSSENVTPNATTFAREGRREVVARRLGCRVDYYHTRTVTDHVVPRAPSRERPRL